MTRLLMIIAAVLTLSGAGVQAQTRASDVVWVQLSAVPNLAEASGRARDFAGEMEDVSGFSLANGWYAIVLGPYTPEDAETVLRVYQQRNLIPGSSFITETATLGQQFWPIGSNLLASLETGDAQAVTPNEEVTSDTGAQAAEPAPQPDPEPEPIDETPRQARASEAALDRDARKQLQVMLQWAGFYNSGIDGAFGRGTRGAMRDWQESKGYEPTGVLTTRQRAELLADYNAVLRGMGLASVRDDRAGIEMILPTGVVGFETYQSPFAHYGSTTDLGARVLLISQEGDRDTLFALYDILQTLEIVPLDGPRERGDDRFTLVGESDRIVSYTEARLDDGQIKGFSLIWPAGDEERRTRVLDEMRGSFSRIEGVLDPLAGMDAVQDVDLMSGLQIRRPVRARSGFFVDAAGSVVTSLSGVEGCGRITLDEETAAEIVARDASVDVAILRPVDPLAPIAVATLLGAPPRLQSEIAVAGYSYEGALGAPTVTFGTLADLRGLGGEANLRRLALAPTPGDAGGPVFDAGGSVLGMLLPPPSDATRQFPEDVSFAAAAEAIVALLDSAGLGAARADATAPMAPEDMMRHAADMTVLVSCWE